MKYCFLFWSFLLFNSYICLFAHGYEIKVCLDSKNDTLLLGHYFAGADILYSDDTCKLDRKGQGVFKGPKKLAKGIYFIINNNRRILDFVVGDEQKFEIKIDTANIVNGTTVKGSRENEIFFEFQRMNLQKSIQLSELKQKYEAADSTDKKTIYRQLQALDLDRTKNIWRMIEESKGLFVGKFLNSFIPMNVRTPALEPQPWQTALPETAVSLTKDSLNRYLYRWYRSHFFDNFDIFDPDMLRTPLYKDKVADYLKPDHIIPQHPDSLNAEIDKILTKAMSNQDIFHCLLGSLFNHYVQSKVITHENTWVHIAQKWFIPHASWAKADYIENLKKEVNKRLPNLINNTAPPIEMLMVLPTDHFKAAAMDTAIKFDVHAGAMLNDFRQNIKSKYVLLFYWDCNCSHCKQAIKELYDEFDGLREKGLQVIAVQIVISKEDKGKWIDFINEHQYYGWINAWSPYSNKYLNLYNLSQFPTLYLLDENKTIIMKNIVPGQVKDMIR